MPGFAARKMRVVLLRDLKGSAHAPQVAHGCFLFAREHEKKAVQWMEDTNVVVVHSAERRELEDLIDKAKARRIALSIFQEPDLGGAITCVVLAPCQASARLTRDLPLAKPS